MLEQLLKTNGLCCPGFSDWPRTSGVRDRSLPRKGETHGHERRCDVNIGKTLPVDQFAPGDLRKKKTVKIVT